jgi:hypothetical protein
MNPVKVESAMTLPFYFGRGELHTLIHTLLLKSPLPNIVVATARSDINIAAMM